MENKIVEVHLRTGRNFFGKLVSKDRDGVIVFGVSSKAMNEADLAQTGLKIEEFLSEMLTTMFFPYANIEYIDISAKISSIQSELDHIIHSTPLEKLFDEDLQ
jgi:hypothetical protein